ncbi:PLP-dependent aminotransferase family protein [Actinomadura miaoliensis]|uniref:PLP-dependent aminotransferase family protein n=1 Tax=Actinomadura miaoliensis TaxID=430685 RepID=A0ABP7V0Y4_9ACTN
MPGDWTSSAVDLHLDLDMSAGRRSGLEHALREAIRDGRLAPRTRLPSTRALARELGIARGTVIAAYDQLVAEGYLNTRQGSGTTVGEVPPVSAGSPTPEADPVSPRHDLRPGRPDLSAFPARAWLRAARRVLTNATAELYALGDPRGRVELRAALTDYLGRARGVLATPDRIVITNGYSQALNLLARVLTESGVTAIALEEPSHPYYRDLIRRTGLRIVSLPVDDLGARTDLLGGTEFAEAGAVVLTPSHQYPTGATLHPSRRHALTEWARTPGRLVIEDDYDGEFRYDRQPVGAVQGMSPHAVAYIGTASKTLAPALRLGWMVLPDHLVEPVTEAKRYADAQTESLNQVILAELIGSHAYERHIRTGRLRYRERRDLLVNRLRRHAPQVEVRGIAAGLHAFIRLPATGPDEEEIVTRAMTQRLAFNRLADHWHRPGDHPQGIIVGYSTPSQNAYPAALDALCQALTA